MKAILILMIPSVMLAQSADFQRLKQGSTQGDWNTRVKYGTAGAKPFDESATQLPQAVIVQIAAKLKDPSSLQIVSWTNPVFESPRPDTQHWKFTVDARGTNSFGAINGKTFVVFVNSRGVSVY